MYWAVGVVDVGETWKWNDQVADDERRRLENAAVLRPLTDKYLTELANPHWLDDSVDIMRGQNRVFEVHVPLHLLRTDGLW